MKWNHWLRPTGRKPHVRSGRSPTLGPVTVLEDRTTPAVDATIGAATGKVTVTLTGADAVTIGGFGRHVEVTAPGVSKQFDDATSVLVTDSSPGGTGNQSVSFESFGLDLPGPIDAAGVEKVAVADFLRAGAFGVGGTAEVNVTGGITIPGSGTGVGIDITASTLVNIAGGGIVFEDAGTTAGVVIGGGAEVKVVGDVTFFGAGTGPGLGVTDGVITVSGAVATNGRDVAITRPTVVLIDGPVTTVGGTVSVTGRAPTADEDGLALSDKIDTTKPDGKGAPVSRVASRGKLNLVGGTVFSGTGSQTLMTTDGQISTDANGTDLMGPTLTIMSGGDIGTVGSNPLRVDGTVTASTAATGADQYFGVEDFQTPGLNAIDAGTGTMFLTSDTPGGTFKLVGPAETPGGGARQRRQRDEREPRRQRRPRRVRPRRDDRWSERNWRGHE